MYLIGNIGHREYRHNLDGVLERRYIWPLKTDFVKLFSAEEDCFIAYTYLHD